MTNNQMEWAVFWCGLLHELIHEELSVAERVEKLHAIAAKEHRCPDGLLKRFSIRTLRRKLSSFRAQRLLGLVRKVRSDRGACRTVPPEVIEVLVDLKRDQPTRSYPTLNRMLEKRTGFRLSRSTLYRILKRAGATRLKLGVQDKKVRRRWTCDHPHDIWVGDFEEGPYVLCDGQVVPTHLSAFIDAHSRYVVVGRYYLRQNLPVLEDSLIRALAVHGAPLAIYLDNAKVYRSRAYRLMCAELDIRPIYRRPGDPAPGGLIERFFRTVQDQFEAEVRPRSLLTLDELNRGFSAWLDIAYQDQHHSEIDQTPRERLERNRGAKRNVEMQRISGFFLRREERTVDKVYADVSIDRRRYRVDPKLRGDRIEVRLDPVADPDRVLLYDHDGHPLGEGQYWERDKDRSEETPPALPSPPQHDYVEDLVAQQESRLAEQARGIDYARIEAERTWPYPAFIDKLARGLGRRGGLSAFDAAQHEVLRKFWGRQPDLTARHVDLALSLDDSRDLAAILFRLQILIKES